MFITFSDRILINKLRSWDKKTALRWLVGRLISNLNRVSQNYSLSFVYNKENCTGSNQTKYFYVQYSIGTEVLFLNRSSICTSPFSTETKSPTGSYKQLYLINIIIRQDNFIIEKKIRNIYFVFENIVHIYFLNSCLHSKIQVST